MPALPITPAVLASLREAYEDGTAIRDICAALGVNRSTVRNYTKDLPRRKTFRGRILTPQQQARAIAALLEIGLTQLQTATALHISPTTVSAFHTRSKMHKTTEHAASSYGIPVWVDEAGRAYGPDDLISPRQAAHIIGRSLRETQRLCSEGLLPALNVDGRFVIRVQDAEAYVAAPRGRPEKG